MSTVTTYELTVHLKGQALSRRGKHIVRKYGLKFETKLAAWIAARGMRSEIGDEIEYINVSKVSCTSLGIQT